jgi:hypothetical protein
MKRAPLAVVVNEVATRRRRGIPYLPRIERA